jgi:hypothetical protein
MTRSRSHVKLAAWLAALCVAAALAGAQGSRAQTYCCQLPDNGDGTIDMPPDCLDGFVGDLHIVAGLPEDTTIELAASLDDFVGNEAPGGTLGGTTVAFDAQLHLTVFGTGDLNGFNRILFVPVSGQMDFAPRNPGDAVQDFDAELVSLSGELFGDPDFCTLAITGGDDFGLPSPGHTTLTRLGPPGSDFQVDSFFDVTYRLEFAGCAGSILEDLSGTTQDEARITTCEEPVAAEIHTWSEVKTIYAR